jgi:DNA-binding transcriptional ArsR family regulator
MCPVPLKELRARPRAKEPRPGTVATKILDFLRKHSEEGWRASELARELEMDPPSVGTILRRLRARGLVDQLKEHWFALEDQEVARRQAALVTNRLANEKWGPEEPDDWVDTPQD